MAGFSGAIADSLNVGFPQLRTHHQFDLIPLRGEMGLVFDGVIFGHCRRFRQGEGCVFEGGKFDRLQLFGFLGRERSRPVDLGLPEFQILIETFFPR